METSATGEATASNEAQATTTERVEQVSKGRITKKTIRGTKPVGIVNNDKSGKLSRQERGEQALKSLEDKSVAKDTKPEPKAEKPVVKAEVKKAEPEEKLAPVPEPKADADKPDTEKKAVEPEKPAPKRDDFDRRFGVLKQAEKRFNSYRDTEKAAIAKQREELEALSKENESKYREAAEIQRIVNSGDKYRLLDHFGLNPREWAAKVLGEGGSQKGPSVESQEIEELRATVREMQERDRQREEAKAQEAKAQSDRAQYEEAKSQQLDVIKETMENNPDRYGYCLSRNAAEAVWQTIEEEFYATGRLMPTAEALDHVEGQFEQLAEFYSGTDKFKTKYAPQGETRVEDTPEPEAPAPQPKQTRKTTGSAPTRFKNKAATRAQRQKQMEEALAKAGY